MVHYYYLLRWQYEVFSLSDSNGCQSRAVFGLHESSVLINSSHGLQPLPEPQRAQRGRARHVKESQLLWQPPEGPRLHDSSQSSNDAATEASAPRTASGSSAGGHARLRLLAL
uniref:Uncharacterized protein n=1 Tax=Biomphalaria glabrata TaxID=6526 RepID=A0A2C9LRD8_BIOGL